jgi:hypothetical protein
VVWRLGGVTSAIAWRVVRVSWLITSPRPLMSAGRVYGLPDSRKMASAVLVISGWVPSSASS